MEDLSTIWDTSREVIQDMPRFTTAELRSSLSSNFCTNNSIGVEKRGSGNEKQLSTPLLVASGSHPKLCPGPLSPLMCPEASHSLSNPSVPALTPIRKWSVANSPSENDLQSLARRSSYQTTSSYNSPTTD